MSERDSLPAVGTARLIKDRDSVVAGSFATVTMEYTVGGLGMDDGSAVLVVFSQTSDVTRPQFEDPEGDAYTTVATDGDATLSATYADTAWKRPFANGVRIDVTHGSLDPGETITLTMGDRSGGSAGQRQQTFVERDFELRILADPVRTGEFVESARLTYDVSAGAASQVEAVLPSTATMGDDIALRVRVLDRWGNPATGYDRSVRAELAEDCSSNPNGDCLTVPDVVSLSDGVGRTTFTAPETGVYRLRVVDETGNLATTTNALVVTEEHLSTFWGDIHGQSGETVGTGTIEEYFEFAREYGFVDFAAHAGNDFQITDQFWETIRNTVEEWNDPGEFITFPCYEWSANTPAGGDHNVYFANDAVAESEPIRRSHSWLVTDDDRQRADGTWPIEELYSAYAGREDILIIPHQGGRPATLDVYDPELTPFLEIASVWGIFEWFGQEAIERGYEVGFVGGSDDHCGRPGAAWPDRLAKHNIRGGLMGVQTESLDRDSVWTAFKNRRVYTTTGRRIMLDVRVNGSPMGASVTSDAGETVTVDATTHGTAPLRSIELFRDGSCIDQTECTDEGGVLVEVKWQGAKGTGRDKVIDWSGGLTLEGARVREVDQFGFYHPQQGVQSFDSQSVTWDATTTGNHQGVRLQIDEPADESEIRVTTDPISVTAVLAELGIDRELSVEVPDKLDARLTIRRTNPASDWDDFTSFTDELPEEGAAYHVRVTQDDGEMAWSSPTYVNSK